MTKISELTEEGSPASADWLETEAAAGGTGKKVSVASLIATAATDYATAAQGATADTATQPGDLGTAAAQDVAAFATGAEGDLATTALQPGATATVTGTTDTLASGDDQATNLYTAAGAVTVTLANIATGHESVLVCLGAGGLTVAAGGMSFANSFTPQLTVAQGEALFVKQTAASTWIVLGGTAA